MRFCVPFGKGELAFDLATPLRGTLIASAPAPALDDLKGAVALALANPKGSAPLRELARPGHKAAIVFTDATRSLADHILVPALLAELEAAGVADADITLVCGTGMHRPSTMAEKIAKLGADVVQRYRVIDNKAQDPESLVDLGTFADGIPIAINRDVCAADLVIATGVVEPHQYAGYSGGRKTVAIGAAGEAFIERTHGPAMVDHPGTRLGRIEGNPFHEAVTEAARRAGLGFILNVVQNDAKQAVAVGAGAPEAAFDGLVTLARAIYEVPVPRAFDVAVAGVGYPKDENIYQACRAASYLFFAPRSLVRDGGVIIVPAPTPEGAGQGVGEQRFLATMEGARDMGGLLADLRASGYPPGAQRAFVMAKVLENVQVIIAGSQTPDEVKRCRMIPATDMAQALELAAAIVGRRDLDVAVVPRALLTLPIVAEG